VSAISWGKFQRLIAVELALNPDDRMDSFDFLKICRAELDRLIEQSPSIPKESIALFEKQFGSIKDLKKPDVCGELEHTYVFESSEARLKHAAVEAALMLKRKKQTLNELLTPQMEKKIAVQVEERLNEAIETRKKILEEEIEIRKMEMNKRTEEEEKALEERRKKIQEEIELEKIKISQESISSQQSKNITPKLASSQFESRINFRRGSNSSIKSDRKIVKPSPDVSIYSFEASDPKNTVIIPKDIKKSSIDDDKIIIISRD
jgi:hypothetical protein